MTVSPNSHKDIYGEKKKEKIEGKIMYKRNSQTLPRKDTSLVQYQKKNGNEDWNHYYIQRWSYHDDMVSLPEDTILKL